MGRPCTICTHADRAAIEAALDAGQPLRDVAADYGTSKTALHRHGHLHVAVRPSSATGARHARSGTRVPAVVRWGEVVAGIVGLVVWIRRNVANI